MHFYLQRKIGAKKDKRAAEVLPVSGGVRAPWVPASSSSSNSTNNKNYYYKNKHSSAARTTALSVDNNLTGLTRSYKPATSLIATYHKHRARDDENKSLSVFLVSISNNKSAGGVPSLV
eukprot:PhM_4_TR16784/c0_g1_i2/m.103448